MTTLVTGGAGYIGSHLLHELADAGEQVVALDDLSTGSASVLPQSSKLIVGSVGDQTLVSSIIKMHDIDAIVHFAGSAVPSDSMGKPVEYYRNNTSNSCSLIETAISCGVKRFIFSSSAAVYGNPEQIPVCEDSPLSPVSPYGRSKLMTEEILRDADAAHGLSYVVLRNFNVAGADPKRRTGQLWSSAFHVVKAAVQTALGLHDHFVVFGNDYPTPDGTCLRDYVHVSDVARAHRAATSYLRRGGASCTLNCGYGRGYSVLQVVDTVSSAAGRDIPVRVAGRRPGDPISVIADTTRIREILRWKPQFENLDEIVDHALAWERHSMGNQKR